MILLSISKVVEFLTEGLPIFDNGILMGFYIKICFIGHRVVWYGEEMGLDKRHFAPCCGQTGVSQRPPWTRYYKVQNNEIYVDRSRHYSLKAEKKDYVSAFL